MVLIDGKEVDVKEVDAAKHGFIGTFRKPFEQIKRPLYDIIFCSCGLNVCGGHYDLYQHWQMGHFDLLQYKTIEDVPTEIKEVA
jgi:hypothetical protein